MTEITPEEISCSAAFASTWTHMKSICVRFYSFFSHLWPALVPLLWNSHPWIPLIIGSSIWTPNAPSTHISSHSVQKLLLFSITSAKLITSWICFCIWNRKPKFGLCLGCCEQCWLHKWDLMLKTEASQWELEFWCSLHKGLTWGEGWRLPQKEELFSASDFDVFCTPLVFVWKFVVISTWFRRPY